MSRQDFHVADALGTEARVVAASETLQDAGLVRDALRQTGGIGWLQSTDTVWLRRDAEGPWRALGREGAHDGDPFADDASVLLDGELYDASSKTSWSLRHLGAAWAWSWARLATDADAAPVATRTRRHCLIGNVRPKPGQDLLLCYIVHHRRLPEAGCRDGQEVGVWRPWLQRFVGFDQATLKERTR